MRPLTGLAFDNSFARLHPAFCEVVDPTPLPAPRLLAFNPDAAALIDLDPEAAMHPDAAEYLSGARRFPGAEPVAQAYAGHQFGVWVPQLGDGRAFLLGEARNARGETWDLHLKGGGRTRWSRFGDGRSVLRSAVREYLACEAGQIVLAEYVERWTLSPGDVVAFRGDQRHSYHNPGARPAIGYSVVVLARVR